MADGPGGHALKENIDQQGQEANRAFNWMWQPFMFMYRKSGQSARKTVTFGDAAEVSGALLWTVASLVVIVLVWFMATTVWGLPSEWYDHAGEVRAGLSEDESYGQRDLLRDCERSVEEPDDFPGLPACSYTQWLSERTLPSPLQVWDATWGFARNGYSGFRLWEHLWLSFSRLAKGLFFLLDLMLSAVILISILGVTMDVAMRMAEKRLIPWRGKG